MILPLPSLLQKASPIRAQANEIVVQQLKQTSKIASFETKEGLRSSLTRNRAGTIRFLLLCIAGFSAWHIMKTAPEHYRQYWLHMIVYLTAITAIAGVVGKWVFPQGDTLFWYIPVPHGRPGPMGGFMNRNHFAGYVALMVPPALALASLTYKQKKIFLSIINLAVAALLSGSVMLSLSRGGMLALLVGIGVSVILYSRHQNMKTKGIILLVSMVVMSGVLGGMWSIPSLRSRFLTWSDPATHASAQDRWEAWQDSVAILQAYPILGAGPNAFRAVYPQDRITSDRAARDFAENEYIQWSVETGIIGILIAFAFVYLILRQAYRQIRITSHNSPEYYYAALGTLAVTATHAFVDFPLRLPLYAITATSIVALLWPHPAKACANPMHNICHAIGLAFACLMIPANLQLDAPGFIASASASEIAAALRASPTYPIPWRRLSALLWQHGTEDARQQAESLLTQAATYDPNNYILWKTLGDRRKEIGDVQGANAAYARVNSLRDWINIPYLPEEKP
jgi:O-antigen ligase